MVLSFGPGELCRCVPQWLVATLRALFLQRRGRRIGDAQIALGGLAGEECSGT